MDVTVCSIDDGVCFLMSDPQELELALIFAGAIECCLS